MLIFIANHVIGLLRLLLAAVIVGWHTGAHFDIPMVSHMKALPAFFVISGFFIALVLSEKYNSQTGGGAPRCKQRGMIRAAALLSR